MTRTIHDRFPEEVAAIDRMTALGVESADIAIIINVGMRLAHRFSSTDEEAISRYIGVPVGSVDYIRPAAPVEDDDD